jgi:probable O-glycosylation ligase (exosortase A-associated)
MRDLPLVLGILAMLPMIVMRPHVGILAWCWTALLVPNFYVFGFATGIRFNLWIAIVTLLSWLMSKEPKHIPANTTTVLLGFLLVWGAICSALTIAPSQATTWTEWEKLLKIVVLSLLITALITTETRIRALMYAVALSMGFHAVDESAKFIATAGGHKIWGPGSSIIGDNNHFALAIIMVIPILLYLYNQTRQPILRLVLAMSLFLQVVAVVGTGSRGGLIGVAALGAWILLTSRQKLRSLLIALLLGAVALSIAPERWYTRMGTIETANQDASFMGRVIAWKINTLVALDHPLTGGGFRASQELPVWLKYAERFSLLDFVPTDRPDSSHAHAAHSIYFQVLGDMGFIGIGLYLSLLLTAWRNAKVVLVRTEDKPELKWAHDLARTFQYCLIPYAVSGAALNMAYFDLAYVIIASLAVLRAHVEKRARASLSSQVMTLATR